jgi:hypothetical protein
MGIIEADAKPLVFGHALGQDVGHGRLVQRRAAEVRVEEGTTLGDMHAFAICIDPSNCMRFTLLNV